jgi:hypothetical protein
MVTARTIKVYRIGTTVRSTAAARGDARELGLLLPLAAETPVLQHTGRPLGELHGRHRLATVAGRCDAPLWGAVGQLATGSAVREISSGSSVARSSLGPRAVRSLTDSATTSVLKRRSPSLPV